MEKGSILIVDDDESVRKTLARELSTMGYEVLSAGDAQGGLEILKNREVDVVISDLRMPGVQGSSLLRIIRDIYPETMRIMLSGFADTESALQAINEIEVYRFYPKPWDSKELLSGIANAIRIRAMKAERKKLVEELGDKLERLKTLDLSLKTIKMGEKNKKN